jgi:hypothetical protein
MIAVLDSIGTYNDKVREWKRYAQGQTKDKKNTPPKKPPLFPPQDENAWPEHLHLELPPGFPEIDPATEAGAEALQATEQRALPATQGTRNTPAS